MSGPGRPDPYAVLETAKGASDAELRAAYRRAVQRHHPDHNGGSPESERRFEEAQEAYAQIRAQRASGSGRSSAGTPSAGASGKASDTASTTDPRLDARLAAIEAELAAARDAAGRARRAASDAAREVRDAARSASRRPSDDELGYVSTSDSLSSIVDDTVSGLADRLAAARRRRSAGDLGSTVTDKMADAFEDIGARLRGEQRD